MQPTLAAQGTSPDGGIAGVAVDVMDAMGAPGAGLVVALENVFPPIPSEVVLPLAGFAAGRGEIGLVAALVFTTIGSIVGALALYAIGAVVGRERTRAGLARMPFTTLRDVDRAEAWFERHGDKAVLFGRMVPVVRSLVSLPAGVSRMPVWRFVTLTAIGSAIWNTIFVLGGYELGERWDQITPYAETLQKVVLGLAVLAVVAFVVRRVRRPRSQPDAG